MSIEELQKKAYKIRAEFLKGLEKFLFCKKINYQDILDYYHWYLENVIKYNDCTSYYIHTTDKGFKLKNAKDKKLRMLFTLIYNMTANVQCTYIETNNDIDISSFFSGFSIFEFQFDLLEAKKLILEKAPNDIDIVELVDIYDDDDYQMIASKKYLDVYLLALLSDIYGKMNYIHVINQMIYILKKDQDFKNSVIYNLLIKLFENILK